MRILIFGATGMLGYSLFSNLSEDVDLDVFGTVRNIHGRERYFKGLHESIIAGVDVTNLGDIDGAIKRVQPNVVINCIGLIKQHDISKQHINAIEINALLPHQIANACDKYSAKLIHFSTDCVFTGNKGAYIEDDLPDAVDLYGRSKCLGEVTYGGHLTLRTSIIGHELESSVSLVDWFLSQEGGVKGFSKAVFSGLPTCYIAHLLKSKILKLTDLSGLYHLSVEPIDKYSLLTIISEKYTKNICISEDADLVIDRSLLSESLTKQVGFNHPSWPGLIDDMHKDYMKRYQE